MSEQIVTPESAIPAVPNKDGKINLLDLSTVSRCASFLKT